MRYNEQLNIKLYAYEDGDFVLKAIIDDYSEISFTHSLYEAGDFTIQINYNIPNAQLFQRGMFIQFGNDSRMFGEILTVTDSIGSDGKGSQTRVITGKDARYIFKRRIIANLNNEGNWIMTAKGELCMRNLVLDQCGDNAEQKRKLPINNLIPDVTEAIGSEYSVAEAYSNLYDVLVTIATQTEIGWAVVFNGSSLSLEFFQGENKVNEVIFSTDFESLSNGSYSDTSDNYLNSVYIGGKGTGADRDIYEGEDMATGESPAGLARYEAWDNQSSMTSESEYEAEAESVLTQFMQNIEVSGNGLAECPYRFKEQYDIGDVITIAFSGKSAWVKLITVTEHWSFCNYGLTFSFGKPLNGLDRQLQLMLKQIQKASDKTETTSSVKYYEIPTDTEQPKADVIYNTIGFTGTVGDSGATFKLYYDAEKTGAKNYHIWFKQLAGTGKLTLTTGVSGKANLELNTGTYVAIIYVDAEGNVLSQGATPTTTIASGNSQPAESGAVADEIENITEIASSLPTDAVLHYSFDEVPDYPDGTADVRLIGNTYGNFGFSANGTVTNDAFVDGDNKIHLSNVNGNSNYKSDITTSTSRGVFRTLANNTFKNKIVIFDFIAKTANLRPFIEYAETESSSTSNRFPLGSNPLSAGKHRLILFVPDVYKYTLCFYANNSATPTLTYLEWELTGVYIGNGSYSTPIIDNANGQNNATNNGGIAVQGVSGKGTYFLNGKYASISNFNLTFDFSVSAWVKPDNNTRGLNGNILVRWNQFILRNGDSNSNTLRVYVYYADGSSSNYQVESLLTANVWSHIVVTRNGTQLCVYRDGTKKGTYTLTDGTIAQISSSFYVGASNNTRPQSIDDVQIFNRALSDKEVLALYLNKANTPKYYNLNTYQLTRKLPPPPTTDGTYTLQCSVASGVETYTWIGGSQRSLSEAVEKSESEEISEEVPEENPENTEDNER